MTEAALAETTEPPRKRWRRWLLILAIILIILLAIVIVVPLVAAGLLAEQQLDRMGIENEGVESLKVDFINRSINLENVEFWAADAERGRIENLSLRYDFANLFLGRAVIDRLGIRGIDIRINRDEDGRIQVNGIALDELLGPPEPEEEQAEADSDEEGSGLGVGVGVNSFLLEDTRVFLTTSYGSELALDLDRMLVEDIRSWDPDHPAIVKIRATVNDIGLEADAQVHLFTETLMADAHVRVASLELAKIERFIGPLGFERRDGEFRANLVTSTQIEPDGRFFANLFGDITQLDADIAMPGFDYQVGNQRIDIEAVAIAEPFTESEQETAPIVIKAAGGMRVESQQIQLDAPNTGSVGWDRASVRLDEVAFLRDPNGRNHVRAAPSISLVSPEISGPVAFETERLDIDFASIEASVDGASADVMADGSIRLSDTSAALPSEQGDIEQVLIQTGPVETALGGIVVAHAPDQTGVAGHIALSVGDVNVAAAMPEGQSEVQIGPITAELADLALENSANGLDLEGQVQIEMSDIGVTAPGAGGAPLAASLGSVTTQLQDLTLALDAEGAADASTGLALSLSAIAAEIPQADGAASIAAQELDVTLDPLGIETPGGQLAVATSGGIILSGLETSLSGTSPVSLDFGGIDLQLGDISVVVDENGQSDLSAPFQLALSEIAAEATLPDGTASVAAPALDISLNPLSIESPAGQLAVATSGALALAGLEASVTGVTPASLSLGGADLALGDIAVALGDDGSSDVSAPFELTLSEIAGEAPAGDVSADIGLENLQLAFSQLDLASTTDGGVSVDVAGTHEIDGIAVDMPASEDLPPLGLDLARFDLDLAQLQASSAQDALSWQVLLDLGLESLAARVQGEGAATFDLGSLNIDRFQANDALAVEADSIALRGLDAEFTDRTLAAFGEEEVGETETSEEPAETLQEPSAETTEQPAVKIGSVTIERPASIRFSDTQFEPAVEFATEITRFDIAEIDTVDPSKRTTVEFGTTINESADLAVSGWANLANQEDFDVELELRNAQLARVSPYIAMAAGFDAESGTFGTQSAATATRGELEGQVAVEVEDLILVPTNEEAAEAASALIGMPVSAVVGLLEDPDGKIELKFPVSGTVDSPEIGIAEVITQAVTASMAAIFPPTAIAGMFTAEGSFELQPVTFASGTAELGEEGRAVADGVLQLLQSKPNLEVLLCGRATAIDVGLAVATDDNAASEQQPDSQQATTPPTTSVPPDDRALAELAQARAAAVQSYLQDVHNIPPERIRECRPRFDPEDTGEPRVDMFLT